MPTYTVTEVKGVHSAPNQLASVPKGALAQARNCVTPFKDITQSRRGLKFAAGTFGSSSDQSNEGVFWNDTLFVHYAADTLARYTGSAFVDLSGSYTPPDATLLRMKFMEAANNLYFTTDAGIMMLDTVNGTPVDAGLPAPLHFGQDFLIAASGGWLEPNVQVAYRVVIGIKDANGNVKLGPPSGRHVFSTPPVITAAIGEMTKTGSTTVSVAHTNHGIPSNFSGTMTLSPGEANFPAASYSVLAINSSLFRYNTGVSATVTNTAAQTFTPSLAYTDFICYLPPGLTTSHFYRVYRSRNSAGATVEPDDELFLVYETNLSSTDISNGYIEVSDKTPETMLQVGAPLYTNPNTGDGIGASRETPPLAKDILSWRSRAFYFNTTDRHRFFLNMLGCGSPDGVQAGDTITVAGVAYTATAGTTVGASFHVTTTYDAPTNIEQTAFALIACINAQSGTTGVVARYIDVENEQPGKIELSRTELGGDAFAVYASRVASWFPTLTTGSTGAQASTAERRKNGFSYSALGQPEAVPLTNFELVGRAGTEILRACAGRDRIFVFLDDSTIHTITGTGPFRVDPLDDTAQLVGPDTVKPHNGQVLALTWQGPVSVSESGVRLLGPPFENQLLELFGAALDNVKLRSFAVSYESDRQYQLWLPSNASDTCCTQAWVYNSLYDTWMPWTGSRTWGVVRKSENKLYMGEGGIHKVRVERKSYDRTDFADEDVDVTIVSSSAKSVVLTTSAGIEAGDLLWQSDALRSLVVSNDEATNTLTVLSTESWAAGAATIKVAIDTSVKWCPAIPEGPAVLKQFRDINLLFKQFFTNTFSITYDSDRAPTERTATISSPGFGLNTFGQGQFGSNIVSRVRRAGVHPDQQKANWIRVGLGVREAWSLWTLEGYALAYEVVSEKGGA